jgi:hypothetical protein
LFQKIVILYYFFLNKRLGVNDSISLGSLKNENDYLFNSSKKRKYEEPFKLKEKKMKTDFKNSKELKKLKELKVKRKNNSEISFLDIGTISIIIFKFLDFKTAIKLSSVNSNLYCFFKESNEVLKSIFNNYIKLEENEVIFEKSNYYNCYGTDYTNPIDFKKFENSENINYYEILKELMICEYINKNFNIERG